MKSADPTKSVRGTFLLITPADTLFTNLKDGCQIRVLFIDNIRYTLVTNGFFFFFKLVSVSREARQYSNY